MPDASWGGVLDEPYTFLIDGATNRIYDRYSAIVYTATSNLVALQWAHDNLPSVGGTILVRPPFAANGLLNVSNSYFRVKNIGSSAIAVTNSYIARISFNAATADISKVHFDDFVIDMIFFNPSAGRVIDYIYFHRPLISTGGGADYDGIVFQGASGTSGVGGETHNVYFEEPYFYHSGNTTRLGFISFISKQSGTGQIYLNDIHLTVAAGDAFIAVENTAAFGPPIFIKNPDIKVESGATNPYYILRVGQDMDGVNPIEAALMQIIGGYFEVDQNMVFVRCETQVASNVAIYVQIHDTYVSNLGVTISWCSFANDQAYKFIACTNNKSNDVIGQGILVAQSDPTHHYFDFRGNDYTIKPPAIVANPFVNGFGAGYYVICAEGDAAVPVANVDYRIIGHDFLISSSNSGGIDCAIVKKDSAGVQVSQAASGTWSDEYCPIGTIVNWGAFTGAAPTIKAIPIN